ncbi:TIGR03667 family PPOX class F420-dependent oxidoreductase [Chloroflexota bacterium]
MIDFTSVFGVRAERRLIEDQVVWLTTVDIHGKPQPRPVWFLWDGESLLVYSRPNAHKVRHIETNPHVSLNFNSDHSGGDIVTLLGEAHIAKSPINGGLIARYVEKYRQGMDDLSLSPVDFSNTYSVAIRIKPTSLRGH